MLRGAGALLVIVGCSRDLSGFSGGAEEDASTAADAADATTGDGGDASPSAVAQTVVSGQTGLTGLAASATDLYWTTEAPNGSVRTCPLASCTSPRTIAQGNSPGPIAFSDRVFWGDERAVSSAEGMGEPKVCEASGSVVGVAVGGAVEYYARGDGGIVHVQFWSTCSTNEIVQPANAVTLTASPRLPFRGSRAPGKSASARWRRARPRPSRSLPGRRLRRSRWMAASCSGRPRTVD